MVNKIIITMIAILLMINLVSAVQYYQTVENIGNDTIRIKNSLVYDFGQVTEDHIGKGSQLEPYVLYDIYPKSFNVQNPNNIVSYCNISIYFWGTLNNNSVLLHNETITKDDEDILRDKYFVRLKQGDSMRSELNCVYESNRPSQLEIPASMTIVTPTWECKSCQYYEWSVIERDIRKAELIGNNTVTIVDYIRKLITLNFEILIAIFWIILIMLSMLATSLIFVGVYWLFLVIRKYTT